MENGAGGGGVSTQKSSGKGRNPNNGVPTTKKRNGKGGGLFPEACRKGEKRVGAAREKRRPRASEARPERGEALKGGEGEEPERAGPAQRRPGGRRGGAAPCRTCRGP